MTLRAAKMLLAALFGGSLRAWPQGFLQSVPGMLWLFSGLDLALNTAVAFVAGSVMAALIRGVFWSEPIPDERTGADVAQISRAAGDGRSPPAC